MKTLARSKYFLLLLLLIAGVSIGVTSFRSNAETDLPEQSKYKPDERHVYCWSDLHVTLETHRLMTQIAHAPGGFKAIDESLRRLKHRDLPDPLPVDTTDIYVHSTQCSNSWSEVYDWANLMTFGGAGVWLDRNAPMDPTNMRLAALKALHDDRWEAADEMFPKARAITMEQSP